MMSKPEFPGERLIACRNPFLAGERARKRENLLRATEDDLGTIAAQVQAGKPPARTRSGCGPGSPVVSGPSARAFWRRLWWEKGRTSGHGQGGRLWLLGRARPWVPQMVGTLGCVSG